MTDDAINPTNGESMSDMRVRAPSAWLPEAAELVDALLAETAPMDRFRERFGKDVLDLALEDPRGAKQAVAWSLALEVAIDAHIHPTPTDPLHVIALPPQRCPHADQRMPGVTWDLGSPNVGLAGCDDCLEILRERWAPSPEMVESFENRAEDPLGRDRCGVCDELVVVEWRRLPWGEMFVEGNFCQGCLSFAGHV
jgi:hypothetical protein